jgi:hypothetical protein
LELDLPWFQSKPCEDLTQLTCRWTDFCQIDHGDASPNCLSRRTASRIESGSKFPQTGNNRGSKLTSLGAPPCPRSMTVCSDLLSELPTNHEDRTLAQSARISSMRKPASQQQSLNTQTNTTTPQSNNPPSTQKRKKTSIHIPNKLALLGCDRITTSTSTSLSFPFPFPLFPVPPAPKDSGEYWW